MRCENVTDLRRNNFYDNADPASFGRWRYLCGGKAKWRRATSAIWRAVLERSSVGIVRGRECRRVRTACRLCAIICHNLRRVRSVSFLWRAQTAISGIHSNQCVLTAWCCVWICGRRTACFFYILQGLYRIVVIQQHHHKWWGYCIRTIAELLSDPWPYLQC
jgi:hypothetical protein